MAKIIKVYRCNDDISFVEGSQGMEIFRKSKLIDLNPELIELAYICATFPDNPIQKLCSALALRRKKLFSTQTTQSLIDELLTENVLSSKNIEKPKQSSKFLLHECKTCGCSCQAQLVGPLNEVELENIEEARIKCANFIEKGINPIMKGILKDGSSIHFINFPQKKCFFLNEDNLCVIHAHLGERKKPSACQRFPYAVIETESEYRLAIKPYCYHSHTAHINKQKTSDIQLNSELLNDLYQSSAYRPLLRNADENEIAEASLQELQILQWLEQDLEYPQFLSLLLNNAENCTFSSQLIKAIQKNLRNMAKMLIPKLANDAKTTHIGYCLELLECLQNLKIPNINTIDLSPAQWSYAKQALHDAVFLREVSRFPSIISGTLALSLGVWFSKAAAKNNESFYQHLTSYFRLLAQTEAFTLICPSPETLIEIQNLSQLTP